MTQHLRSRTDHQSFLRLYNSYRNMSRLFRQYFYGNKELEEIFTIELRAHFMIPILSECPTDRIKHGGERRFADQVNRDEELASYNTHPYQLMIYSTYNKYLANEKEKYDLNLKGEFTPEQQATQEINRQIKHEESQLPQGEKLTLERKSEIILAVGRQLRNRKPTRDLNGEPADFLEQRRPFAQ